MKYMLIDVTTIEGTSILKVAPLRQIELLGRLAKAAGQKVIAPPLEGRGLSKLEKLPLQYLYWSVCQRTPPEDYADLVSILMAELSKIPMDQTPLEDLEKEVARICPDPVPAETDRLPSATNPKPAPKEKKPHVATDPLARPKATTTTGWVWEIADKCFADNGNKMPDRKVIIDACVAEEINSATASTQFAKWKKAKEAGK